MFPTTTQNFFNQWKSQSTKVQKIFILEKYQDWYMPKVDGQLERGIESHNVEADVKLTTIKPIHQDGS